ncbi:MAG TPA: CHASE2 domain-containing protein [Myxococcota bacterium]|nr:CHASE2 domain-containing protein [Myxococcota bacterium]
MGRPWWRRAAFDEECEEPGSHLARAMAYETLVVAFTAVAVAVLVFVVSRGQFEDLYVKVGGATPSDEVVVMSIGEEALHLWDASDPEPTLTPRGLLAQLVTFCDAAGASVVVLDVLLDRPAEDDILLLHAARSAQAPVVGATRFMETEPVSGAEFAAGLAPIYGDVLRPGFANLQVEEPWLFSDAKLVRKAPLRREVSLSRLSGAWPMNIIGAEQGEGVVIESLALVAARAHGADIVIGEDPLLIAFSGPERSGSIPTVRASAALRALGASALAFSEGLIFLDDKDAPRAREAFEKAVAADPNLQPAKDALAALEI